MEEYWVNTLVNYQEVFMKFYEFKSFEFSHVFVDPITCPWRACPKIAWESTSSAY
jgi:hypothetical protein